MEYCSLKMGPLTTSVLERSWQICLYPALTAVVLVGVSVASSAQDPVGALLKTQYASNIPGIYQSAVEPGALLILRDHGHTVAFEDASDMAVRFPKRAAKLTLGSTELAKVSKASLSAKLFGYEPSLSFGSNTQLSYDETVFSGTRLTGFQLTTLVTKDVETMTNIEGWLHKGYHVYLVEEVLATPRLYVTATKASGGTISVNSPTSPCSTAPPGLPAAAAPAAANDGGQAPPTGGAKTGGTVKPDTEKPGGESTDGTKPVTSIASPAGGSAQLCKGLAGRYGLDSTDPVPLVVKLQEVRWHEDPKDANKVIYDYEPVGVIF